MFIKDYFSKMFNWIFNKFKLSFNKSNSYVKNVKYKSSLTIKSIIKILFSYAKIIR